MNRSKYFKSIDFNFYALMVFSKCLNCLSLHGSAFILVCAVFVLTFAWQQSHSRRSSVQGVQMVGTYINESWLAPKRRSQEATGRVNKEANDVLYFEKSLYPQTLLNIINYRAASQPSSSERRYFHIQRCINVSNLLVEQ